MSNKTIIFLVSIIGSVCLLSNCEENKTLPIYNNTIEFTQQNFEVGTLDFSVSSEFNDNSFSKNWIVADSLTWRNITNYYHFDTNNVYIDHSQNNLILFNDFIDSVYTGAMVYSKKTFKEGFFEIRCKFPYGFSTHAAFWLLGSSDSGTYDEIDIVEVLDLKKDQGQKFTTSYYNKQQLDFSNIRHHPDETNNKNKLTDNYHIYSLKLTNQTISWYWNNQLIRTENNNLNGNNLQIFLTCLWLNSRSPNKENPPSVPGIMAIDYVRVFEL